MKKLTFSNQSPENKNDRIALHGGTYSLIITVVVLAILVVINIFAGALPESVTKLDISSSKLYSVTSNTKTVLNNLKDDVTIYWIVQSGEEDDIIENLLKKYDSLSDHVTLVKKNPDVYPTFAEKYTDEEVKNNSIVVECGERNKFISFDEIYLQEADMETYSYNTSFDGEGAVTSAIDFVVNEEQPRIYVLEGHGEAELPAKFSEQLDKANMELNQFSLLNVDQIPEEADCVMIYAPENDLSVEETTILENYVDNGGKLMVSAGPVQEGSLDNLYGILENYGVETVNGVVVEADRAHYAFQQPFILMPDMGKHTVTQSLIDEKYFPIMPISQGVKVPETSAKGVVTPLLTTSDASFSKAAGYNLSTYEKEDGDTDGPFAVALSVESTNEGQIIWFNSSHFLDDMYNAYSSGANINLGMNSLYSMIGESDAMSIRSKSLNYDYLTISESASSLLKILMIGVFPVLYLAAGIIVVVKRRRRRNEAE